MRKALDHYIAEAKSATSSTLNDLPAQTEPQAVSIAVKSNQAPSPKKQGGDESTSPQDKKAKELPTLADQAES